MEAKKYLRIMLENSMYMKISERHSIWDQKKKNLDSFLCLKHHRRSHKLSVDSLCFAKGLAGNDSAVIKSIYDSIKLSISL